MELSDTYRLAFELSRVPLLLVSPDGLIQRVNRELEIMFEYPEGGLLHQSVECLLPPDARGHHSELREAFGKFPTTRRMGQGRELSGITRDGRIVPLELSLQPVDHDGEAWVLVTAIDRSVRSHGEQLARATLDAAASAMIMVGTDGMIVSVNPAANTMFLCGDGDLVGKPIEVLLPENIRRRHVVFRNSFFVAEQARPMGRGEPLSGKRSDGTEFPVEVALTPINIGDERLALATVIDLSERLVAQREAEAHANRLAILNDELTQFAYSVSHDLKAPLSTIAGMLRVCIDDINAGRTVETAENLEKLFELSTRSAGKVENVLRLARIGVDATELSEIDLDSITTTLWNEIVLNHDAPPRLDRVLTHERPLINHTQALSTILENLLSNAVQYSDKKKTVSWVRVESRDDRDMLEIRVSDNGVGIAAGMEQEIFGMFRKLHAHSGDGLGLSIVRRYVDSLGGQIACTSQEGEGSAFTLRLPMQPIKNEGAHHGDHCR